jgi:hypothetical protein
MVPKNVAFSVRLPKSIQAVMPPAGGSFCIPHRILDFVEALEDDFQRRRGQ